MVHYSLLHLNYGIAAVTVKRKTGAAVTVLSQLPDHNHFPLPVTAACNARPLSVTAAANAALRFL